MSFVKSHHLNSTSPTIGQAIFAQQQRAALDDLSAISTATSCRTTCPSCQGPLIDIRMKLVCADCHAICETCCEGGRG